MRNILILEDEEIDRKVLRSIVDELPQNCHILETASCKEGYCLAMEQTIHLFLIDVMLEGDQDFSGFKFVQNIREIEKYREVPIVFVSSVAGYELMAFRKMHCFDFITKPFKIEEVRSVLISALRLKSVSMMKERVDFESGGIYYPVDTDSIRYIESNYRILYIHTVSDILELPGKSLKESYELLNKHMFFQIHKSFIVSRLYIEKVDYAKKLIYIRDSDRIEKLAIGKKYKEMLREWLNDH